MTMERKNIKKCYLGLAISVVSVGVIVGGVLIYLKKWEDGYKVKRVKATIANYFQKNPEDLPTSVRLCKYTIARSTEFNKYLFKKY